ncbi:cytidylyltransferase domain-containing protein [Winogradskyella sp. R77965]|uniref:cytidylyltransferase domain-containing protein n=1 Tax=Winogradskyella sp. R77965 TaxID=3093872 RepID=UPI0037DCD779
MNIAFIPVRGGSKGIPGKNIKSFLGRPLIYWVISELQNTDLIDKIILATDSNDIKNTAISFGFSKVEVYDRNVNNAQDHSSTESVMIEFIESENLRRKDCFMLVQATSPLTTRADFTQALQLFEENRYDSVLSCARVKRFFWNESGRPENYDFKLRPRRQDFKGSLLENGALYINTVGNIIDNQNRLSGKIGIYEMPEYTAVEIDEEEDWLIAESLMRKHVLNKISKRVKIKLFVSDVDGVLTDAGMYYTESGDELKKFNTHDGMAFQILRENGVKTGIVTSEDTNIVSKRASKLKVDYLYQGKKHNGKLSVVKEICEKEGISLDEVAYIGDDVNCFELLSSVGYAACPANAVEKIKSIPHIIKLGKNGGQGVVREFITFLGY